MSTIIKYQKITPQDKNYPQLLKEIPDSPHKLYVWGVLKQKEKYPLAVVGTRKVSNYGKQVTIELVKELAKQGLTIISGLALGVDGISHQAALDANGRTIAVLGSGFDHLYPQEHAKLANDIVKSGGAIITEYPPDAKPTQKTFPARNRIIAGMSLGVLVIEAPMRSGALITARHALEQNRDVFAVPGSIYNKNSAGTNNLIKMGAKPVTSPEDILESFNLQLP
ncbi:DNA-processing protein DprA [Patescibacteria group bacterium AH-259-L07]|nr:DNA-processing protein DprA [Patescibacteria group bacterium AH-259-L07]